MKEENHLRQPVEGNQSDPAQAYDQYAGEYDRVTTQNLINAYMRAQSLASLHEAFHRGNWVLDIGCGTGEEAISMALNGVNVVALDPSERMLNLLKQKMEEGPRPGKIIAIRLKARDIADLKRQFGCGSFDGAYASFSLSYERSLHEFAEGLRYLLRSGAEFQCSVLNRICISEFLISLLSFHPSLAGRRLRDWVSHKVGERHVGIKPYTPAKFLRYFLPSFRLKSLKSFPIVMPPPYLNAIYDPMRTLHDALASLDAVVQRVPPFRFLGDHLHFILEKTS